MAPTNSHRHRRNSSMSSNATSVMNLARQLSVHSLDNSPEYYANSGLDIDMETTAWSTSSLAIQLGPSHAQPMPPTEPTIVWNTHFNESIFGRSSSANGTGLITPPDSRPCSSYAESSRSGIRTQRQRAVRRQCSVDHLQDIQTLVARMVASGELCEVVESHEVSNLSEGDEQLPDAQSTSNAPDEDGMITVDDDDHILGHEQMPEKNGDRRASSSRLLFRRSIDGGLGKAARSCVSKSIRLRKHARR